MNISKALRAASAAALVTLVTGLAACGGGGADPGTDLLPPVAAKSCVNTPGNLDTVQSTLSGLLAGTAERLPTVGPAAADASRALAWTVDAVDALLVSLEQLARTQNPTAFTGALGGSGDALQCATGSLSDTLAELSRLSGGTPIPGLAQVQALLDQVAGRTGDGLSGQAAGADLRQLTGQLSQLSSQLALLSGRLPVPVDQPLLRSLLCANAVAFGSLANILADLGALRGEALVPEVSGLLRQLALELPASLASQAGLPTSVLQPLAPQLQQATQQFEAGTAVVVVPLFRALSMVLGSGLGTAAVAGPFSDLIDGALSGLPLARVDQIAALLPGGLTAGAPSLLTELLRGLGGLLPGGG